MQLGVNEILNYLLKYYEVHQYQDLAIKMGVEKTTLSGWKSRGAMGPLLAHLAENDPAALSTIFTSQNNHFGNIQGMAQNFGRTGDINNNSAAFAKMDKAIVAIFENVYQKMEKEDKLQELFATLSQLYFGQK